MRPPESRGCAQFRRRFRLDSLNAAHDDALVAEHQHARKFAGLQAEGLVLAGKTDRVPLIAGPAFIGNDHIATCKLLNVTDKTLSGATIELFDTSDGTVITSFGPIDIAPNQDAAAAGGGPNTVACRFVGGSKKKVRATLTIYESAGGDFTDKVVIAAQ